MMNTDTTSTMMIMATTNAHILNTYEIEQRASNERKLVLAAAEIGTRVGRVVFFPQRQQEVENDLGARVVAGSDVRGERERHRETN